jgi:hypothetical protein
MAPPIPAPPAPDRHGLAAFGLDPRPVGPHSMGPRPAGWLPAGKSAAVCFSVDDIHPSSAADRYDAGGDLAAGALGRLVELQRRHPMLKTTLCVTPDWRLDSLVPDRWLLPRIPWVNRHVHWTRLVPDGALRIDRHPALIDYLNGFERCEIVPHGLTHAHTGPRFAMEFQEQSEGECIAIIERGLDIFRSGGLRFVRGYVPPAWNAPAALLSALDRLQFEFLSSARDLGTPIARDARASMSGLTGVSLLYPELLSERGLVHLSCNFQATSSYQRAIEIIELSGVLHIKAHIFKSGGGHVMLDGLDDVYCNYLDALFSMLEKRLGGGLWWAHLSEVAHRARGCA